jgi:hypothetical protein
MSFSQLDIPHSGAQPFTDYSRWRLVVDEDGRHTFTFLKTDEECKKWPQTVLDKYWLGLPTVTLLASGSRTHLIFSIESSGVAHTKNAVGVCPEWVRVLQAPTSS